MATFPLVFSSPEDAPIVGRFEERVDLAQAVQPVHMYWATEELIEEPDLGLAKDSEYYRRKRNRRKQFRAQSHLVLEDSTPRAPRGPPRGVLYEGRMANLNLNGESAITGGAFQAKPQARSVTEAPFKYLLLQPQRVLIEGVEQTQIVATPVGGE